MVSDALSKLKSESYDKLYGLHAKKPDSRHRQT